MIKKICLSILIIVTLFTITGCFGAKDLREVSISTAFAIDREQDGRYTVSVQIIKPSAAQASGGKDGGGGSEKSFLVVSNTEDTVFAALRGMLDRVKDKIFYSSAQVIVIGESVTKAGVGDAIDFLLRDHETQYRTLVAVAKGVTAKEIIEQKFELSKVPGAYIQGTMKNSESTGFTQEMMLLEVARELATQGRDLCLPTITKSGDTTKTAGSAVFLEDKQVGMLDNHEVRGFLFATGEKLNTIIEVESPADAKKKMNIEIHQNSAKKKLEWTEEGKPVFSIDIKAKANISEQSDSTDMQEDELIKKLEQKCNDKIKEDIMASIKKCQSCNSDIFGFGAKVFDKNPRYW